LQLTRIVLPRLPFSLQLDGDEPVDDDYDSLAPSSGIDPFSVPSFAPVMRVVDPVTPPSQQPAGMKQLTIQLAGANGSKYFCGAC
jgi:hypothetical protein